MFVVATLAAMIASQAMISATFSCIKQSMVLGCFPRLKIIHTSKRFMGQIYIPVINWFLMIMCIAVVAAFRSTNDIANAYGDVLFYLSVFRNVLYCLYNARIIRYITQHQYMPVYYYIHLKAIIAVSSKINLAPM